MKGIRWIGLGLLCLSSLAVGQTAVLDGLADFKFKSEISAFAQWDSKNSFPQKATLFVGSSSIRYWHTATAFPDIPVINRGFGGSVTAEVLEVYPVVIGKYTPARVVIYVGDNDIASGVSVTDTVAQLKQLFSRISTDFPQAEVIFLPIKPSLSRWHQWPLMQQVNQTIQTLANMTEKLTYVDVATPLLNADGEPDKSVFRQDGLHLNDKGYAIWNKILAPYLK
ncbi:GDSL-type esterase/lipase family protein [Neptunicella sp. SCSIO 80796]|uniref:GDSL-type esterase/lipase family protein n=1 Tax=Neptunicella plasticusilytica TaxID=3117012 RepID=UPI003A4D8760